jgi:hypothetical protein
LEERLMTLQREYQRMMMQVAMTFMTGVGGAGSNLMRELEGVAEEIAVSCNKALPYQSVCARFD